MSCDRSADTFYQHLGNCGIHQETPTVSNLRTSDRAGGGGHFGGKYNIPSLHLRLWDSRHRTAPALSDVFVL